MLDTSIDSLAQSRGYPEINSLQTHRSQKLPASGQTIVDVLEHGLPSILCGPLTDLQSTNAAYKASWGEDNHVMVQLITVVRNTRSGGGNNTSHQFSNRKNDRANNHPCRLSSIPYHHSMSWNPASQRPWWSYRVPPVAGDRGRGVQQTMSLNDFRIISFLLRQSRSLYPRHLSAIGTSNTNTTGVSFLGVTRCTVPSIPHRHCWRWV